jgi:uncharacterized membrane protein
MDPYLIVLIITLIPWIELRGSIPVGILLLGLDPMLVFVTAVIANTVVAIPIYLGLEFLYPYFKRFSVVERIVKGARKKGEAKVKKYGVIGLALFVGVPLPVTGVWTGTLIAWLLHMDFKKAILALFLGVLIAASIITALSLTLEEALFPLFGLSTNVPLF